MPEDNRRSAVGGCFGGAVVRVDSHHTVGFSGGCLGAKLTFFLDNPKRCGFVFFDSVDNNCRICLFLSEAQPLWQAPHNQLANATEGGPAIELTIIAISLVTSNLRLVYDE